MGTTEDKIEKTITGDITETITGNTTTHQGNQTITTLGEIIENHTGSNNGDSHTALGAWNSQYLAIYSQLTGGLATEKYLGGKLETHPGLLIANKKGG